MKKYSYYITIVVLSVILIVVTFYMLFVHVPYNQYHNQLNEIKNQIVQTNNFEYLDYFYEHRGKETYYILKVNINDTLAYVAYDKQLQLIDVHYGEKYNESVIKQNILNQYGVEVDTLDIGYENNKFVYVVLVQEKDSLLYIYYDAFEGDFIKAYHLTNRSE